MAGDVQSYLWELQTALTALGADPALVQDALFDAEEYLQEEVASGVDFAIAAEGYGSPAEVAAAYVGVPPEPAAVSHAPTARPAPATTPTVAAPPPIPTADDPASGGPAAGGPPIPPGVQAGMTAAEATSPAHDGFLKKVFQPFTDLGVYLALAYMLISLGTGIAYFTIVVTGMSVASGMLILIIGIPLLLATLGIVRAVALFESRVVEVLLGTRMPRRPRAEPPDAGFIKRIVFWVKDSRTWLSMLYMVLMLPIGIAYFVIAVVGVSVGVALTTAPLWAWVSVPLDDVLLFFGQESSWWILSWAVPLATILGVLLLIGFMHLVKWIGRGHAAFAKSMLVRLGI